MQVTTAVRGLPGLKYFIDNTMRDGPIEARKAVARTLNETMVKSQGIMAQEASRIYAVTQRDIRQSFRTFTANYKDMRAGVKSVGNKFNLSKFGVAYSRSTLPQIRELRGVRTGVPHSFMVITKSGHMGIFHRKGKTHLPIVEMVGGSPPQMIHGAKAWPEIQLQLQTFFWHNLKRNMHFYGEVMKKK